MNVDLPEETWPGVKSDFLSMIEHGSMEPIGFPQPERIPISHLLTDDVCSYLYIFLKGDLECHSSEITDKNIGLQLGLDPES